MSLTEDDCQSVTKPKLPGEVWVLIVANAVIALGYGVVAPVLPAYARHFGVSISAATFVITAFALMRLCFAPATGVLDPAVGGAPDLRVGSADRRCHHRRVRVRADVLAAAAVPVAGRNRFDDVLRVGAGTDDPGQPGGCPRPGGRDLFSSAFLIGSVGGPVLGSLTAGLGLNAPFVIYGAALTGGRRRGVHQPAALVTGRTRAGRRCHGDRPHGAGATAPTGRRCCRTSRPDGRPSGSELPWCRCSSWTCCIGAPEWRDWRLATFAVGNVSAVIPSGYLSDRVGRRLLLIVGLTAAGISTVMVGFTDGLTLFLVSAYIAGFSTGIFTAPQQAAVADIIGNKARGGTAVATFQMMADVGSVGGSLLVGLIAQYLSFSWAFVISGVILLVAAVGWIFAPRPGTAVRRARTPARALGPEAGGEVP